MVYSLTASAEIKSALARIAPPEGCVRFRTNAFTTLVKDTARTTWVEARMDPATKLWTIVRHNEIGEMTEQTTLHRGLGFFDALHECGAFEAFERTSGAHMLPPAKNSSAPHFYDTGNLAFVPFDAAGIPHPAVDGMILTDGVFSKAQREIGERSNERKEVAAPVTLDTGSLLSLPARSEDLQKYAAANLEKEKNESALKATQESEQKAQDNIRKKFHDAANLASDIADSINRCISKRDGFTGRIGADFYDTNWSGNDLLRNPIAETKKEWNDPYEENSRYLIVPLYWIMLQPIITTYLAGRYGTRIAKNTFAAATGGDLAASPKRRIGKLLKDFEKSVRNLPDHEDKTLLEAFAPAAQAVFTLEQLAVANQALRAKQVDTKKYLKFLKAAEKPVQEALQMLGTEKTESARILAEFAHETPLKPGTFCKKILEPRMPAIRAIALKNALGGRMIA